MESGQDLPARDESKVDIDLNAVPMDEPGNITSPTQHPLLAPAAGALPVEVEQGCTSNPRPASRGPVTETSAHTKYNAFINILQEQFYKAAREKEELMLENIRLQATINNLRLTVNQMDKENKALKKKLQEVSAFFRWEPALRREDPLSIRPF